MLKQPDLQEQEELLIKNTSWLKNKFLVFNYFVKEYPAVFFVIGFLGLVLNFYVNLSTDAKLTKSENKANMLDTVFINQEFEKLSNGNYKDLKKTWVSYDALICLLIDKNTANLLATQCEAIIKYGVEVDWLPKTTLENWYNHIDIRADMLTTHIGGN